MDTTEPRRADTDRTTSRTWRLQRPTMRWVWLIYLVFFLMGPILYGTPASLWRAIAGLVVFLPLYAIAGRLDGWPVLWPILGKLALGLFFVRENPGASVFFVYAAAECGRLGPRRRSVGALGVILALIAAASLVVQAPPFFWIPAVTLVIVIGIVGIHERELETKNRELTRSREEVEQLARIAERERIARDLHDLLGHTLSLVILKAELARKLAGRDPARAASEIAEVETIARKALGEVRAAVAAYRAETFAAELENARAACSSAGVALETESDEPSLPALHEGVLALALREAITNVVRHAGARHCSVVLRADGGWVRLAVEDDGRGAWGPEGHGLRGMRERVESLGGRLATKVERGTKLTIELPLVSRLESGAA